MNSFRPGPVPPGLTVGRPLWPRFDGGASPVEISTAAGAESPLGGGDAPLSDSRDGVLELALSQARMEAAEILQDAAAAAESALDEARRQGFEAGCQEGVTAGKAELESLHHQGQLELERAQAQAEGLRQTAMAEAKATRAEADARSQALLAEAREQARLLLEETRAEQHRRLDEAQVALVELAVAAAMRLVQGHLALQPAAVVAMVASGLRRLRDSNCTVRVSSQDLPLLEAQRSTLERELGSGLLQVQPDPGLTPGSYLATSSQGQIDARLEQQAEHLRAALNAALGGGASR